MWLSIQHFNFWTRDNRSRRRRRLQRRRECGVTRSGRWACGSGCWPPGRTGGPAACRTRGWSPRTPRRTPCGTAAGTGWAGDRRSHLWRWERGHDEHKKVKQVKCKPSSLAHLLTATQVCVFAFFLLGPQLKVDWAAADGQRGFGRTRQVCNGPETQSRVSGARTLAARAFFQTEVPLDVLSGKDVGGVHDVLSDLHAPGWWKQKRKGKKSFG